MTYDKLLKINNMKRKINNKLIRSFNPCYDPSEIGIIDSESLSIKKWILKYRDKVKSINDIIWVVCRNDFMNDRNMRLFAVWCAREALKLVDNPDQRSINVCNVAELFANGKATKEELTAARYAARDTARYAARDAAWYAARDTARDAAWYAARDTARDAARDTAWYAARYVARDVQIDKLLTYFK